jgi:dihydrofolate reductase
MRKIKLYIASSLDGKIARPDGNIDWLDEFNSPAEDYGYNDFMDSVDTTVMGNTTYQQILKMGPGFPYNNKRNYVFTRNSGLKQDGNVTYRSGDLFSFVQSLKQESGKDIWLVGGGQVNAFFLNNDLIDELILFFIPVLIGDGIPLFDQSDRLKNLTLTGNKSYPNGVVELKYNFNNA